MKIALFLLLFAISAMASGVVFLILYSFVLFDFSPFVISDLSEQARFFLVAWSLGVPVIGFAWVAAFGVNLK